MAQMQIFHHHDYRKKRALRKTRFRTHNAWFAIICLLTRTCDVSEWAVFQNIVAFKRYREKLKNAKPLQM